MKYHHYKVNNKYAFSISDQKEGALRDITIFENGEVKSQFEYYDHFNKLDDLKRLMTNYIKDQYVNKEKTNNKEMEMER